MSPTCSECAHLQSFELSDDLFTCPVVNIRLHAETVRMFGCNLFESKLDYSTLDPGIRDTVQLMRSAGFRTGDSGDGVSKPKEARTFHVPHVACSVTRETLLAEADRLALLLGNQWRVEASFCPNDGSALLLATSGEPPSADAVDPVNRVTTG